jgi:hypothetical protein
MFFALCYPSVFIFRLYIRLMKKELIRREPPSAMGNAHQRALIEPVRDNSHAAGSNTTNWRMTDTMRLVMPFPIA